MTNRTDIKKIVSPYSPSWLEHKICGGELQEVFLEGELVGFVCNRCNEQWKIIKEKLEYRI